MRGAGPWLVIMVLAVGAPLVSCSSGSGAPTPLPVDSSTPAAGAPTVIPAPDVEGSTYRFAAKGYAIDPPNGWTLQANTVFDRVNGQFPSDAFFAPEVVDKVQPSLSITCQKARPDQATSEQFRDARQSLIKQIANADVVPRQVTVDGVSAFAFDYTQQIVTQGSTVDATDVVFVANGCRWLVSLAAPGGQRAKYAPLFDQALGTMKLLGPPAGGTPVGG